MARLARRKFLKAAGTGAAVGLGAAGDWPAIWTSRTAAQAPPGQGPIRIGFQLHRTGIGAVYGRWYDRTGAAAVKLINEQGGIGGRPVELVIEDDGTDPRRGGEVVEKLATQHKVDLIFGTLFSHVVIASAPRAGELKIPYLVVSEGYHVASGKLNRYVLQPGITDVRAQVTAVSSWIAKNLGKKVALMFPDYAFGHDHRDFFSRAIKQLGGEAVALVAIPPTETSFTRYFPRVPADADVLYHVMVGPGVLTFVKEMGEHFGQRRPQIFGFVDSLEGVDMASPGLEFLEGTYFWEGFPRYAGAYPLAHDKFFRERVGVDANGARVNDPRDVSTYAHMFGVWETLFVIKRAIEQSGYKKPGRDDYAAFIQTIEKYDRFDESPEHPQGAKKFVGPIHQVFGHQYISKVENRRLKVVHRAAIEDSLYPPEGDYTKQPF